MGDDEIRSSVSESPNWGTRRKRDIDELLQNCRSVKWKYTETVRQKKRLGGGKDRVGKGGRREGEEKEKNK
jgi:hypothetical protein